MTKLTASQKDMCIVCSLTAVMPRLPQFKLMQKQGLGSLSTQRCHLEARHAEGICQVKEQGFPSGKRRRMG